MHSFEFAIKSLPKALDKVLKIIQSEEFADDTRTLIQTWKSIGIKVEHYRIIIPIGQIDIRNTAILIMKKFIEHMQTHE